LTDLNETNSKKRLKRADFEQLPPLLEVANAPLVGEWSKPTPYIWMLQENFQKIYANVIPKGFQQKIPQKDLPISKLSPPVNN
jgi:hypothetical protein